MLVHILFSAKLNGWRNYLIFWFFIFLLAQFCSQFRSGSGTPLWYLRFCLVSKQQYLWRHDPITMGTNYSGSFGIFHGPLRQESSQFSFLHANHGGLQNGWPSAKQPHYTPTIDYWSRSEQHQIKMDWLCSNALQLPALQCALLRRLYNFYLKERSNMGTRLYCRLCSVLIQYELTLGLGNSLLSTLFTN